MALFHIPSNLTVYLIYYTNYEIKKNKKNCHYPYERSYGQMRKETD